MTTQSKTSFKLMGLAAATFGLAPIAAAQAEGDPVPGARVSGVLGADIFSHFVSYGFDVWGDGDRAFSGSDTFNPYAEISIDFDAFTISTGVWGDVNDNSTDDLGGDIQEIDVYVGIGFGIDKFSFGITYQEWAFLEQTEDILDVSIGFDDTGLIFDDFAFNPSILFHNRVDNGNGLSNGTVFVLGIEPGFTLIDSEAITLDMTVPTSVGFVFDDGYFIDDGDDGFGYVSVGLAFGLPLDFIPVDYGAWALNAGVTAWFTESDVYDNPDDNFLVYNLGLSLAF